MLCKFKFEVTTVYSANWHAVPTKYLDKEVTKILFGNKWVVLDLPNSTFEEELKNYTFSDDPYLDLSEYLQLDISQ